MLMANLNAVLQRPKIAENYARNAFDRSQVHNLHYNLGAITPFFAEQFIAGSHVKLNRRIFQRTAAVNTAAFPTIDTHCEFFYVPLKLLWSQWYNWKLNIQDIDSSMFTKLSDQVPEYYPMTMGCPNFNLAVVQNNILDQLENDDQSTQSMFANSRQAMGARRLLDNLGYGIAYDSSLLITGGVSISPFLVNAFKLAAYQKVYYDHFRNTAYETNDPTAYNLDLWSVANTSNYAIPDVIMKKLLALRYVNYRKDYFQALYPALNYVSSDPRGSWSLPDSVVGIPYTNPWSEANNINVAGYENVVNTSGNTAQVSDRLTVNSIRAAFALDKLSRASAYTPKHVVDQMEARYGVKGVESGNESVRIGAMMSNIVIGEVTSTSDLTVTNGQTVSGALGAIGGKGIGSDNFGKDIEFTCKDDCIILGVMYSLPRAVYDSTLVKNWNAKLDREDFFIPEYMNLGLQPIEAWQAKAMFKQGAYTSRYSNNILGYQPRYMEYKEGIDLNHGQFNANLALSDFVPHSNQTGSLANIGGNGVTADYFKVKATDLDSVFAQDTNTADDTTDKFITHLEVKCICNQNMSVHGQPSAGGLS